MADAQVGVSARNTGSIGSQWDAPMVRAGSEGSLAPCWWLRLAGKPRFAVSCHPRSCRDHQRRRAKKHRIVGTPALGIHRHAWNQNLLLYICTPLIRQRLPASIMCIYTVPTSIRMLMWPPRELSTAASWRHQIPQHKALKSVTRANVPSIHRPG
jgi:hypothetical protein